MTERWPEELPVVQVRMARPTDKLTEVVQFYCTGLGLKKLNEFHHHQGYSGVMIGLPQHAYHLEFTTHVEGSPCPAPSKDNLLVLYIPGEGSIEAITKRLDQMGYPAVEPENPYWKEKGTTIEDPDGWRIVLMNTEGIGQ
jgi:catechol 2,3-dioxygenase-like lactoylglutathione lyase family enzyme